MTPTRTPWLIALFTGCCLLAGCNLLPPQLRPEDARLREALEEYTSAKAASERGKADTGVQQQLTEKRSAFETAALETAAQRRMEGALYESRKILDTALEQVPDSAPLLEAREEIEDERNARLRINDCRLGAARARFLTDKADLLQTRAPLESKDFLTDWKTRREQEELSQLAVQLRDCGSFALFEERLDLAEETLAMAARINGPEFVAEEQAQLTQLKNPPPVAQPAPPKPKAKKRKAAETTQQKLQRTRLALQSAITRGDLRQAQTEIAELRKLEGDTPQLVALDRSINDAITSYISDAHERANALYRDRQIEQARDIWQRILELDPNDTQARANLERAERVLKKLEELQGITPEAEPAPAAPETTAPATTAPGMIAPSATVPATTAPTTTAPATTVPAPTAPTTTAPAPTAPTTTVPAPTPIPVPQTITPAPVPAP